MVSSRTSDREAYMAIVPMTFGFNNVIRVPESWDCFLLNGFLYRRNAEGRFVVDRAWAKKTA